MTQMNQPQAASAQRDYFGKYRGQVVNNADPLKKGRLQITVPQVLSATPVCSEPCVPYAVAIFGF